MAIKDVPKAEIAAYERDRLGELLQQLEATSEAIGDESPWGHAVADIKEELARSLREAVA